MDYEAAKKAFLEQLILGGGRLRASELKGKPFHKKFLGEYRGKGLLVLVEEEYRAAGALAQGIEEKKEALLGQVEIRRQQAAQRKAEKERIAAIKKAEEERIAAEREAERQKALALTKKHFQAFREEREKIVTITGLCEALGLKKSLLEHALASLPISSCVDGRGWRWFDLREAEALREEILGLTSVNTTFLAACLRVTPATIRRRLAKLDISPWQQGGMYCSSRYYWADVRVLFPEPYPDILMLQASFDELKAEAEREKKAKAEKRLQAILEKKQRDQAQLMAMFPITARASWPHLVFSVGATNSGKTHAALEALAAARSGVYLAPLRLLAWEVYERLNAQGIPCDLVTGEEVIRTPHARHQAATVEMFQPAKQDVIVLDEAQMAANPERGGAWTRVLTHAQAEMLYLCCAPEALALLQRFTEVLGYPKPVIQRHERLCPLQLHDTLLPIEKPEEGCIYIVFSRIDALVLKSYFEEEKGIPTSVLYGALPPDVRRAQAERFLRGETKLCVATDALGMGMNLPARYVAFTTLTKFDGTQRRSLTPAELQQIAGRAGRFGLHEIGLVGACSGDTRKQLRKIFTAPVAELTRLRIHPTLEELATLSGSLQNRLAYWAELHAIPPIFQALLTPCDIRPLIQLAEKIPPALQSSLGLEASLAFAQAPVHRDGIGYWKDCLFSFAKNQRFPLPSPYPHPNYRHPSSQLLALEESIRERELFLWLANRPFFAHAAPPEAIPALTNEKHRLSQQMDEILCRAKLQEKKQCKSCGKNLPPLASKRFCNDCNTRPWWFDD